MSKPRIRVAQRKVSELAVLLQGSYGWTHGKEPWPQMKWDATGWVLCEYDRDGRIIKKPLIIIEDIPLVGCYGSLKYDFRTMKDLVFN